MSSIYTEIKFEEEIIYPDNHDLYKITDLQERFAYLADRVYKMCIAYFDTKQLRELLIGFKTEILPYIIDHKKVFQGHIITTMHKNIVTLSQYFGVIF